MTLSAPLPLSPQPRRERLIVWASVALAAVALTWLAAAMPATGFYSGDSGAKLIAARNAIAHPGRPFEVTLPTIGGRAVPYVDRFFEIHGDHAHALQSPLFPVLSAIPLAAFGLRGVYLLPLVSLLALLPLLNVIQRHTEPSVHACVLAAAVLPVGPVFFYGLEFWEHAPAIACIAASTALILSRAGRPVESGRAMAPAGIAGAVAGVIGGIAGGIAVLLRPEAVWYVAGLMWISRRRRPVLLGFVLGVGAVLGVFAVANYAHFGNFVGPHVAANLAPLGDRWVAARWERIQLWLLPWAPAGLAGVVLVAAASIGPLASADLRKRQTVALLGSAVIAVAAAGGAFGRDSLWSAWPAGSLLFVPRAGTNRSRDLWLLALFSIAAIWLTSTHEGGAQWGPRFLLIAAPPLIVLSAAAAADAMQSGYRRRLRQLLVVVVLLAGIWTTRAAYRDLRGTKRIYAGLVEATESLSEPRGYLVSDVWWFDQAVAALYGTRTFLFAEDSAGASAILRQLAAANVSRVTLVWSRDGIEGRPLNDAVAGTCYRITGVREMTDTNLTLATAACPAAR